MSMENNSQLIMVNKNNIKFKIIKKRVEAPNQTSVYKRNPFPVVIAFFPTQIIISI